MAITTIVMDVYKPGSELKNKVVDISDSFNARVGDNQVRLVIKYVERGIVERMEQEQLTPFMMGWVGQPDEEQKVTSETGIAVSYHGSTNDIIGGGKVRMDLPGTMFPQEGMFYGFFGLENDKGKRVTTNTVRFQVENDNPDMYVDTEPFRSELQKLLDWATAQAKSDLSGIGTDWEALKATIKAMIEKDDTDLITISNRIGLAEDDVAKLLKKISDAGLAKMTDIQPIIDELTKARGNYADLAAHINAMGAVDVDESMVSGGFVKSYFEPEIKRVKAELLPDLFTFTQMNDTHWETLTRNRPEAYRSLNHIKNALSFADVSDLIILNGDNTNSDTASLDGVKKDVETFSDVFFDEPLDHKTDRFIGIGNHDDGSTRRSYATPYRYLAQDNYLHDAYFRKAYRSNELLNGETRNNGSLYFFKDYPKKKIRFILINTNDIEEGVFDDSGSQKFDRWGTHTVRQEQLNWLVNVALANVPSDYHVVVMGHTPLNANQEGGWHDSINNGDVIGYHNLILVADVLNAFRDGAKVEINSSEANFPLNITADFTTQGPRNLVGYFCGHTHRDGVTTYNKLSIIEVPCSVFYNNVKSRFIETATEDGFDVIQIDTTNRNVNIHGFGYCENRSVKY
ncbi:metallophosphoesterase family protein [Pediococcus pentosaceus]|uniref:metallophosphoesterase family protein n=1 Tax=Pediococcus pentosaceus TaxID=1255 RepID=UPI00133056FE|nr:metallophosphoesterase [Pediococcus pentosaceus]KAF0505258.1 capsid protein [Pediococcus pentosaceus]